MRILLWRQSSFVRGVSVTHANVIVNVHMLLLLISMMLLAARDDASVAVAWISRPPLPIRSSGGACCDRACSPSAARVRGRLNRRGRIIDPQPQNPPKAAPSGACDDESSKLRGDCAGATTNETDSGTSSYDTTSASSRGVVSILTAVVNGIMGQRGRRSSEQPQPTSTTKVTKVPPKTPVELLERIRDDYVVNNYLWTGDISVEAFEDACRFTDPTLSFVGVDTFVSNVRNLRPIVDALIPGDGEGGWGCRSDLIDIKLVQGDGGGDGYVETRWNMVGDLSALPWKPRIDVVGRTKFWYNTTNDCTTAKGTDVDDDEYISSTQRGPAVRVFFYDEKWEMPASKALLQLVTPPGTFFWWKPVEHFRAESFVFWIADTGCTHRARLPEGDRLFAVANGW